MAGYYYIESGMKRGPVNAAQLKALALRGIVGPTTRIELPDGKIAEAGKIRGLVFTAAVPFGSGVPDAADESDSLATAIPDPVPETGPAVVPAVVPAAIPGMEEGPITENKVILAALERSYPVIRQAIKNMKTNIRMVWIIYIVLAAVAGIISLVQCFRMGNPGPLVAFLVPMVILYFPVRAIVFNMRYSSELRLMQFKMEYNTRPAEERR